MQIKMCRMVRWMKQEADAMAEEEVRAQEAERLIQCEAAAARRLPPSSTLAVRAAAAMRMFLTAERSLSTSTPARRGGQPAAAPYPQEVTRTSHQEPGVVGAGLQPAERAAERTWHPTLEQTTGVSTILSCPPATCPPTLAACALALVCPASPRVPRAP